MTDTTDVDDSAPPKTLDLTPQQKQQWEDTMSMMAWKCPGFRHIMYRLLNNNTGKYIAVPTKQVDTAATDARNIMINPDNFFKFGLPERVFILGHEIVHNMFGDVEFLHRCTMNGNVPQADGKPLPFRNDIMQKAMDMRINALLMKGNIGKVPQKDGKPFGHFDDTLTGEEGVIDIYAKVYEKEVDDTGPGDGTPGPDNNPGGFDNLQKPGKSTGQNPNQAAQQRNPQQWAVEIAAARTIEEMRSQGKMAGALKRMFEQLLEPEVDWRDHIQTLINRIGASGGWNWKEPDPWWVPHDFFAPRPTGHGAGWIVIWGDTSGSRSDGEIASNLAELKGMMEDVNPARLTVLWCDADIDYIDEIVDPSDLGSIQARGTAGGGGTSVEPVMEWIKQQGDKPDLFIGFTDGYVTFPPKPDFPVIWASSTDHTYPYGETVRVNQKDPGR